MNTRIKLRDDLWKNTSLLCVFYIVLFEGICYLLCVFEGSFVRMFSLLFLPLVEVVFSFFFYNRIISSERILNLFRVFYICAIVFNLVRLIRNYFLFVAYAQIPYSLTAAEKMLLYADAANRIYYILVAILPMASIVSIIMLTWTRPLRDLFRNPSLLIFITFSLLGIYYVYRIGSIRFILDSRDKILSFKYCDGFYLLISWYIICHIHILHKMLQVIGKEFRSNLKLPIVVLLSFFGCIIINFRVTPDQISAVVVGACEIWCVLPSLFWYSILLEGIFPSNLYYEKMINVTSLPIMIKDNDGRIIYRSEKSYEMPAFRLRIPGSFSYDDGQTVIQSRKIGGGLCIWMEDRREITRIRQKLEEINVKLEQEAEFLKIQNDLKEKKETVRQKMELYNMISEKTAGQHARIYAYASLAESIEEPGQRERLLKEICVIGAYIKRRSNLMLLAENYNNVLPIQELFMSIGESMNYLRNLDIHCEITCNSEKSTAIINLYKIFDIYQSIIESNLPTLSGVMVNIADEGMIRVNMIFENVYTEPDRQIFEELKLLNMFAAYDYEDQTIFLKMTIKEAL